MSSKKRKVLRKEIKDLLSQDVIEIAPANTPLFENYIFSMVKPSGKIRVIFDMKQLNTHIKLPKLKMFTFDKSYQSLLKNNFACRIDLSNAFWHIGVNCKFRKYLAFAFDNKAYCWKAMPFGLRTAPFLFCSLMNTLVKNIRLKYRIIIFFYMDDLLVLGHSLEETFQHIQLVVKELQSAGFAINFEKSLLIPSSKITFLGIYINLELKTIGPSIENVETCIKKSSTFLKCDKCSLKMFQSLVGSLNFVAPFMKFGKLHLSPLHKFTPYFTNEFKKKIPLELKSLLNFWSLKDSYAPIPIPNFCNREIILHADASQQGWGAQFQLPDNSSSSFQGLWSDEFQEAHINVKELRAVWLALSASPSLCLNSVIKVFSDNKTTVAWLNKGTSIRSELARDILFKLTEFKLTWNCQINASHIKGSANLVADSLSRSLDLCSELSLNENAFKLICKMFNFVPEVDLFASHANHKCSQYYSASPDPNALGVDALAHNWDNFDNLYAFPPTHLINKLLYKYLKSKCNKLLLLVPRVQAGWHKNLRRLSPIMLPYQFKSQDFTTSAQTLTPDLVNTQLNMVGYLL